MKVIFSVQFKRVITFITLMIIFASILFAVNYLIYYYLIENFDNPSVFVYSLLQIVNLFFGIIFFNVIKVDYFEKY